MLLKVFAMREHKKKRISSHCAIKNYALSSLSAFVHAHPRYLAELFTVCKSASADLIIPSILGWMAASHAFARIAAAAQKEKRFREVIRRMR